MLRHSLKNMSERRVKDYEYRLQTSHVSIFAYGFVWRKTLYGDK